MKWETIEIGNVLTLQRGFDITKKEQKEGEYPVVSSSGIQSFHNDFKVKGEGVVIGRKGTLGTCYFLKQDFWAHDTTLYVKDFKGNYRRFVYYLLQTLNLASLDVGSSNPTLNRNHVHKLKVTLPPLQTQRKIASILSAYDDLIENNLKRIKLLEEKALCEYKLIVDFKKTETLGQVLKLNYGKSLSADNRKPGIYPVYGSSGAVGFNENFLVKGPGVIVGRKGNVGTVFWSHSDFFLIDTVYFVESKVSLYFLYFNLKHSQHFDNSDAAVPGLNRNSALSNNIHLPSLATIKGF